MEYDAVVVGAGMAGLTAAAYLCKAGKSVALLEKRGKTGGLVDSFERNGFTFDGGIRAVENSGIVFPMLRQLGVELEFLQSPVSIGFGDDVLRLSPEAGLDEYRALLRRRFPGIVSEVDAIVDEVARVMDYMAVLYGIDNPLFLDLKDDPGYVLKVILPWMLKYMTTMPKVARLRMPVDERLAALTGSRELADMIGQHFFKKTPAYFALSYFSLYLDYRYPRGGTGRLPEALESYIRDRGGSVMTGVEVAGLDAARRVVTDASGREYGYRRLVWAADSRLLYRLALASPLADRGVARRVEAKAAELASARGGDSIFTLYVAADLPPVFFSSVSSAHFFYTPRGEGLSSLGPWPLEAKNEVDVAQDDVAAGEDPDKEALLAWLGDYLERTTYEISIPVLRDPTLAPEGKAGLIVSTLMDYDLAKRAEERRWYDEYKEFCSARIVDILDRGAYPGLRASVIERTASTPVTIRRETGNTDGAITGWAFTNPTMPAVNDLPKVTRSIRTPIPGVYQAGQWTFSPSGLPISILTGKLAADAVVKDLR